MHKGTRHTGKSPEALRRSRDNAERFKLLQKKLAKAVEAEDFEQAAKVRDELKNLTPHTAEPAKK
jgi:protein arginine kinase activator